MENVLSENGLDQGLEPGPTGEGFKVGLYLEHLEEASFLYEQRLVLLDDPEVTWLDLHDFEERFEAHIDALVLGEDLALAVCRQQARDGDFGELHATVRVFCRLDRPDLFREMIEFLDPDDDDRVKAVADALYFELPEHWLQSVEKHLSDGDPAFTRAAARAIGSKRLSVSGRLTEGLAHVDAAVLPDLIWSLGRLRDPHARQLLYNTCLQHDGEEVRAAAAIALLRIGEPAALQYCAGRAGTEPWALLPLALGGGKEHVGPLVEIAASDSVSAECMLALGLLGASSAVEPLLYHLGDDTLAEQAAVALYLITGAELYEDVYIPEQVDEDELFDDELIAEEHADDETSSGGPEPPTEEPRGITITRLSQQPNDWRTWWGANKTRFRPGVRYRSGRPYSPEGLIENLAAERSPQIVRRLAAEELVIRYGCDVPFESDVFVVQQLESLSKMGSWLSSRTRKFESGKYYLSGRLLSR